MSLDLRCISHQRGKEGEGRVKENDKEKKRENKRKGNEETGEFLLGFARFGI